MARGDEWCELCDDKVKSVYVTNGFRDIGICGHCASMCTEYRRITEEVTRDDGN